MQVWRFAAVEGTLSQGERLALVTAPQVLVERVSLQAHQAHSWPSSGVGEVCRPSCFEKIPDKSHCGCFFFFFLNMARRLRGQPTEVGKLGSGSLEAADHIGPCSQGAERERRWCPASFSVH